LQASLEELTASEVVEVCENGGSVAPFSGMSWEVRGDSEKPLLHLWSEQFSLKRRVLAITDHGCGRQIPFASVNTAGSTSIFFRVENFLHMASLSQVE